MEDSNVVHLFHQLDEVIQEIVTSEDEFYLASLANVLQYIHFGDAETFHLPVEKNKLDELRATYHNQSYTKQEIHRAIQMALLKGMQDETQANHRMTPESIALFISYLIQKLIGDKEQLTIFNPASGTGNLLHTVLGQLEVESEAFAGEIDETLIRISAMTANILKQNVEYFQQDSLRPLLLDPVDMVISDLPVGYYPDEERASEFQLKAEEGMSFSHHLFIEQSLTYTKPGGYLIFLIPEFLFTSEQADQLQQYLHEQAHVIGVFQLSDSTFRAQEHKKSIFILRKKGEHTENVKQPLLVMLPSLNDTGAMENILVQINEWFADESSLLLNN